MSLRILLLVSACLTLNAFATVRYVDANAVSPQTPYTNWQTAARNIQDAVEVAAAGDEVVVTNGVYRTGGALVGGLTTNRVAVNIPMALRSVNGPEFTVIEGYQVPGATNVAGAMRCVYLTNGASLNGFTLTNGGTWNNEPGGGVLCESRDCSVSNCVIINNQAFGGAGADGGTLEACLIKGNSALGGGGGVADSALRQCIITENRARWSGGGAQLGTFEDCVFSGNSAGDMGGGFSVGTARNCTISNNLGGVVYAEITGCRVINNSGTGVRSSEATNCIISGNSAGGAVDSSLYSCVISDNLGSSGAGVSGGELWNCTVYGNAATENGGGARNAKLRNCIIYSNAAPREPNYTVDCTLDYCCTAPRPPLGVGNISVAPLFVNAVANDLRLQSNSPCIDAGQTAPTAPAFDADGVPRLVGSAVDIGAYEFQEPPTATKPYIISQPEGSQLVLGTAGRLQVTAFGSFPLSYQWQRDGADLPGATNRVLTIPSARPEDDGTYSVLVSNAAGYLVSSGTVISVVPPTAHYVDLNSAFPLAPYTNWQTAARVIQDAVDVAMPGDEVIVTNGVYETGGRVVGGMLTNRVAVDRAVSLRSVNGPDVTTIRGYQAPGTTNGDTAIRCLLLADGATVSGFTIENGATRPYPFSQPFEQNGGGVYCASTNAAVTNCLVIGNSAGFYGGGIYSGTVYGCLIISNSASYGGGVADATVWNSKLLGNAAQSGGAADYSTLRNCAITGNVAAYQGGGTGGGRLINCTVVANRANYGGGVTGGYLTNSIVYFNTAKTDANVSTPYFMMNCCTTSKDGGIGTILSDPLLAGSWYLSAGSPCRGAGLPIPDSGSDIDGESWENPPSIGCDEFHLGNHKGDVRVSIAQNATNIAVGYPLTLNGVIDGKVSRSTWDFGDGSHAENKPIVAHAWQSPGIYAAVLRAFNDDHPEGVTATVTITVGANVYYVSVNSTNPVAPYSSWSTAARDIQDAVDAATAPGSLVLVGDGVYQNGGKTVSGTVGNRVAVQAAITVRSLNGPQFTTIDGLGSETGMKRCVYLAAGATLSGFTLSHGAADEGGGAFCESMTETVLNCRISGNTAGRSGGGAKHGTLRNCTLEGNSVLQPLWEVGHGGGGASSAIMENCLINGNNSALGGGTSGGRLINCIVTGNGEGAFAGDLYNCTVVNNDEVGVGECNVYNSIVYYNGPGDAVNHISCPIYYSCTIPAGSSMGGGFGIITNAPQLTSLDIAGLRLLPDSPCINAGTNSYVRSTFDLAGNRRINGGTVDMGAYEYVSPSDSQFFAWLRSRNLATDGSADYTDVDGDGLNNWQEWVLGTEPLDATSALRLEPPVLSSNGVYLSWQSVPTRSYFIQRSTNSGSQVQFDTIATGIAGTAYTNTWLDTNYVDGLNALYRIGVAAPQ